MRRKCLLLVGAVVILAGVTLAYPGRGGSPEPSVTSVPEVPVPSGAAERLAGAVRIPTTSAEDPMAFDGEAFLALHTYLQEVFPRAHADLRREVVGGHSLLYTWHGSDASL